MTLREYLARDRMDYYPFLSKEYILDWLLKSEQYWVRKYVSTLRKEEYYTFYKKNKILQYYYRRKRNILGRRLGFFMHPGVFGSGLKVWHYGSALVHPKAHIGKNCTIHGNCCVGNKGSDADGIPVLGDNVDIGQCAQILGGVRIADGVKIGAGAVVIKSIETPNVSVAGVPARVVGICKQ